MKYRLDNKLVAFVLLCVAIATSAFACPGPSKSQVRKAIEASYRLPAATNDVIAQVKDARERNLISAEQARAFGESLNKIARAEVIFVGMVKAANEAFERTGKIDDATQSNLRSFFDLEIVGPFLRVLETAKLITPEASLLIMTAITAARLLIRTIAGGIGSGKKSELGPSGGTAYSKPGDLRTAIYA